MCGHESEPVIVIVEPTGRPAHPPGLPAARPGALGALARVLRGLPWGVIGVVAVIGLLAFGARTILEANPGLAAPPTRTPAPTPSAVPTRPATAVPTTTPTFTPAPVVARTPTVSPRATYTVRFGDTCGDIAERYGLSVRELAAYNDISLLGGGCFIVEGANLRIPAPTPTVGPTPTLRPGETPRPTDIPQPTATLPAQLVYEVRAGDVCGVIADRFRISVRQIIQQNKLDDDCTITLGQRLTLVFATPTPSVTNTPVVAQTPTPRTGYGAPLLLAPADGETYTSTAGTVNLQWLSAGILREREWYVVQIQPSGALTVPIFETKATSLRVSRDLLGGLEERSFAWWVQVKELVAVDTVSGARVYRELSPASVARRFVWKR